MGLLSKGDNKDGQNNAGMSSCGAGSVNVFLMDMLLQKSRQHLDLIMALIFFSTFHVPYVPWVVVPDNLAQYRFVKKLVDFVVGKVNPPAPTILIYRKGLIYRTPTAQNGDDSVCEIDLTQASM
eukprot:sb/3475729/